MKRNIKHKRWKSTKDRILNTRNRSEQRTRILKIENEEKYWTQNMEKNIKRRIQNIRNRIEQRTWILETENEEKYWTLRIEEYWMKNTKH
jgi:hypothetical protein